MMVTILCLSTFLTSENVQADENNFPKHEMRASWISTVVNIDLAAGMNEEEFTEWAHSTIQELERKNFNTIIFQVKPTSDAFYPSEYAPWSKYITGEEQGTDPGYDPLQIMLDVTHKHGLELHAWINPYRVTMISDRLDDLADDNIAIKEPDWVVHHGSQYYLNPGIPEVQDYLIDTVKELVENYDVDAVHMDDYFYPGVDFDDEATFEEYGDGFDDIGDWRRNNVNELVENINLSIKEIKPWVQFGISPSGIWRNKADDPEGSDTNGQAHYDALFADSRHWIREELIDYITPQIYWSRDLAVASYTVLLEWWSEQVEPYDVNLYIGMADYKVNDNFDPAWDNPRELPEQIIDNREYGIPKGQMHFTLNSIFNNALGYSDIIDEEIYNYKALAPSIPWNDPTSPKKPAHVDIKNTEDNLDVLINSHHDADARKYAIYRFEEGVDHDYSNPEHIIGVVYKQENETIFLDDQADANQIYTYGVTAISNTGIESEEAQEVEWAPEIVDKTELALLIDVAEQKKASDYTRESWQPFNDALIEAKDIFADEQASQEEVNDILATLEEAMNNLEQKNTIDTTELEYLIAITKLISNKNEVFTPESYEALQVAIQEAEDALDTIETEYELFEAMIALLTAIGNLELSNPVLAEQHGDITQLVQLINKAKGISNEDGTYTKETYADLLTAIKQGEAALVSYEEVPEAITALESAIEDLVEVDKEKAPPSPGKKGDGNKAGGKKGNGSKGSGEKLSGKKLPMTATTMFNWMLLGVLLIGAGITTLFLPKRRKTLQLLTDDSKE